MNLEKEIEEHIKKGTKSIYWSHKSITNLPETIGPHNSFQELEALTFGQSQLKNLQTLLLWRNQLTNLPESIGQLKNLQTLDLERNQLTNLPESIGQLKNLQELSLSSNQLTNLPESIGQLKNLQTLDLERNQLTNLPESIGHMNKLLELWLYNNPIYQYVHNVVEAKRWVSIIYPVIRTINSFKITRTSQFFTRIGGLGQRPRTLRKYNRLKQGKKREPINDMIKGMGIWYEEAKADWEEHLKLLDSIQKHYK